MRQGYYFSLFPATTGQAAFACLESCSRLLSSLPVLTTAHPAPATQRAEGALQNESDRAPPGRPRISAFSACRSQMRCHSWCYSCFSSSSSLSSLPSQLLTQDLLPHWPPCLCSLNGWSSFLSLRLFLLFSLPGMLFSQFLERRVLLTTWSQQRGAP